MKLEEIPELPSEEHPYFLLPERRLALGTPGGAEICYREAGAGRPVLLLHGLWTSALTFRGLIAPLSRRFRVVMPALIDPSGKPLFADGEGRDHRPAQLADLFLSIIRCLELESPVVVGHAESGLAGVLLALRHPQALSALVAVGMCTRLSRWMRFRRWLSKPEKARERWARKGFEQPLAAAAGMLDYADPAVVSRQEIRHLARRWSTWPGAQSMARVLSATLQSGYRREVLGALLEFLDSGAGFPVPLKLVYGERDRRAPLEQGIGLNRLLPGSELLVAENSAGMIPVERPEWLAQVIASAARD